jgi:hypothetical protein
MRKARFGCLVFCVLAVISGCEPPYVEWSGRWKLNPSKSSFQGPVLTISISADGEYRLDDGTTTTTFRCDGQYRPMGNNRTQNCVKSSATTLDRTRKENGVKTNTYHWELSEGGVPNWPEPQNYVKRINNCLEKGGLPGGVNDPGATCGCK